MDQKIAQQTVDLYRTSGMWPKTVELQQDELARWEDMLIRKAHIFRQPIPYERIVDPRPFAYAKQMLSL